MKIKALYIHIPFCDHICIYCDFYKMIAKDDTKHKYVNYLVKELNKRFDMNMLDDLETIYIGGGTPSNLHNDDLNYLLLSLHKVINFKKIKEFTIECNPKDINPIFLETIKKYNVNRISLGAQSLNNSKLQFLNRNHQEIDVINSINLIKDYGFNNINCDLIYGVNNDTAELMIEDVTKLINLGVNHLSCYSLIIEDKTVLSKMIREKKYVPIDDERDYEIYYKIKDFLTSHGFNHYEISNYAKKGYESIHNLTYWNDEYYLGVGANASYYYDHTRYTNIGNLEKYFKSVDNFIEGNDLIYKDKNILSIEDEEDEFIILGLRKTNGISIKEFNERFNIYIFSKYNKIQLLINDKYLIHKDNYIFISPDKLYIMNSIINKIIE